MMRLFGYLFILSVAYVLGFLSHLALVDFQEYHKTKGQGQTLSASIQGWFNHKTEGIK